MTIGDPATWTVDAARKEARRLKMMVDAGRDPRQVRAESVAADLAVRAKATEAKAQSFEKLMFAYADYLKDLERDSHRDVRSIANNHRSEEHTSELQSLMRISYAVFCLKKKK